MFCLVEKNLLHENYKVWVLYENDTHYFLPRNILNYIKCDGMQNFVDKNFVPSIIEPYEFTSTLRDEQVDILNEILSLYKEKGFVNGIVHARPGFGKSIMSIWLANYLNKKTLVVIDTLNILEQWKAEIIRHTNLTENDIGLIKGDKFDVENKRFIMTTPQTLASKIKNDLKGFYPTFRDIGIDFLIWDECLSKDTEILTDSGWQLISELNRSSKVAQFNNITKEISFVMPVRYIENDYNGKLVNLKNGNIDLLTTPNHEQPIYENSNYSKINVDNIKFNNYTTLPVFGKGIDTIDFNNYHRFLIALQADGTIQYINKKTKKYQVSFAFNKQRKINRLLEIVNLLGWECNEVKCKSNKRRFLVYPTNVNIYKNFNEWIDISTIGYNFCNSFIAELVLWDGSVKDDILYYSTTIKSNADIVQQIGCLAGYRMWHGIQIDNRKETYKDVHRFRFYKNGKVATQTIIKSYIDYNDKVYCVEVPDGNIVTRRNNKVVITGNCHKMGIKYASSSLLFNTKNVLGLSATPYNPQERDVLIKGIFDEVIVRYGEYDFQPTIKFIKYQSGLGARYGKRVRFLWDENFIQARSIYNSKLHESSTWINHIYQITKKEVDEGNRIILMCMTKIQLNFICKFLEDKGITATKLYSEKHDIDKSQDNVIVATYKYASHAFDYKELNRLILTVPLMGKKSLIQTIGRIVRRSTGKTDAIVYDLIDVDEEFRGIFSLSIKNKINILNSEFDNCKFIDE